MPVFTAVAVLFKIAKKQEKLVSIYGWTKCGTHTYIYMHIGILFSQEKEKSDISIYHVDEFWKHATLKKPDKKGKNIVMLYGSVWNDKIILGRQ